VQHLRAISVIAVFLFHSFPDFFTIGYLGVDLFFFISGYLIFPQIFELTKFNSRHKLKKDVKRFMTRRIYRIVPALGLCICVTWILFFFFGPSPQNFGGAEFFLSVLSLFGLGNFAALNFSGDYFNSVSPLTHFWSLGVEMQAYIFMAVLGLILAPKIKGKINRFRFLILVIIILSFLSRFLVIYHSNNFSRVGLDTLSISGEFTDFYFTGNRIWEFSVGGLVATLNSFRSKKNTSKLKFLSLMVIVSLLILNTDLNINIRVFLLFLTASFYLRFNHENQNSLFSLIFLWIGNRSYSIYLYHLPILFVFTNNLIPQSYIVFFYISSILMILLLANFSYRVVEQKCGFSEEQFQSNLCSNHNKLYLSGYLSPIFVIVMLINLNQTFPVDNKSNLSFKMNYAASELSKCPLGQIEKECLLIEGDIDNRWLLLGDSHAGALQGVIGEIAMEENATLLVWNKCRFFDPKISSELNALFPKWCIESNTLRMEYINKINPNLILVAYQNSNVRSGSTTLDSKLWYEVFKETLNSIKKERNRVILFSQIPEYPNSPTEKHRFSFKPEKAFRVNQFSTLVIERDFELKMSMNQINVIDLSKTFCDINFCTRYRNNWLYLDSNHISNYGAELLKSNLRLQILKYTGL
jgi:peptidoglycan/LPS O-acetylase OafA/YrhL